ncbi:MAG: VanW family protein [Candidatus Coproplasma sp.]
MLKRLLKITVNIFALVLLTGAFIFCSGFTRRLPGGVLINGVDVGGLTVPAATEKLREREREYLSDKRLRICAGERVYEYVYPEINFTDDFTQVVQGVKKKGDYTANVAYYLNGQSRIAAYICDSIDIKPKEPYCTFNRSGEPFTYYEGEMGYVCDRVKLIDDINCALEGGFEQVDLSITPLSPEGSLKSVQANTKELYTFTTCFDGANVDRAANIRLAAKKINGTVLYPGEVFSFNNTVGARTAENGFKQAKIIQDGKYVTGYGGGVCQVSTTLYNAAALSGLEICEYHPHTLKVSYVPPSRDAMVSGSYFDLKFKNTRLTPVYIRTNCTFNSVTCTIYGQSDGYDYCFDSRVIGTIPKPEAVEIVGEEGIISLGWEGTESIGRVIKSRNGASAVAFERRDSYAPAADVVGVGQDDTGRVKSTL